MIDHLELMTQKLEEMRHFYATVLAPLDYSQKVNGPALGFGDGTSLDFFFREGEPSTHVHFAFHSPSRKLVDEIYERARQAGLTLDRAPELAPHIHPHYYAGYLRDPDGRLVEFVCHKAG